MRRVFLADDHAVVRVGLRHVLMELGGFAISGEADNGRAVLQSPALASSDALVLDLSLPIVSGTEVLRRVRASHPSLAIVVHSMHPADQFASRAFADGADDYVAKDRPPAELVLAIRNAITGRRHGFEPILVVPPAAADAVVAPHSTFTQREHQIFQLVIEGRSVADIAAELDVHSCTVSNHLARVRQKLGVNTVAEVVKYAFAAGLVGAGPYGSGD
jgi:DNA-binding NarL/FixJ family response regulator